MDTPATESADTHDAVPGPSPAGPPDDAMIHCMSCDYNVTYTPEGRCPECGQPFDRDALIEWTTGRDQPLPFGRTQPHKFRSIFLASLFTPTKLGRQLPPYPDVDQAFRYSLGMKAFAMGLPLIALICTTSEPFVGGLIFLMSIGVLYFVCSLLFEMMIATAFCWLARAQCGIPKGNDFPFWLTFTFCFAGYATIVAVVIVVGSLIIELEHSISSVLGNYEVIVYGTIFIMPFIIALWWWVSLSRALHARSESSWRATAAALLVPIVPFVSVCATVIMTILLMG